MIFEIGNYLTKGRYWFFGNICKHIFLFQESQRAINDINQQVRRISTIARKYYSQSELEPLDVLEAKTEETIHLMSDLNMALRCEPIFRYVDYFFTLLILNFYCVNFWLRFVEIIWQDFLNALVTTVQFIFSISFLIKIVKIFQCYVVKNLKIFCYKKQVDQEDNVLDNSTYDQLDFLLQKRGQKGITFCLWQVLH